MIVTRLKLNKPRHIVEVYVDGDFLTSLQEEDVVKERLKVGVGVGDDQYKRLKYKGNFSYCLNRILNFLSFRPRSKREITRKLDEIVKKMDWVEGATKEELEDLKKEVIQKTEKLGFINDLEFAKWFAEGRIGARSPSGFVKIKKELYAKGVAKDTIEEVLGSLVSASGKKVKNDQNTVIEELALKKLPSIKDANPYARRRKLAAFLLRRGYEAEAVFSVVDTIFKTK